MRQLLLLLTDLALIIAATAGSILIRDNLEFLPERFLAVAPYLGFTIGVSLLTLPAIGAHRAVWRFSAIADYLKILAATAVIIGGALALGFAFNRMDGVPRTLPILQGFLIPVVLIGARMIRRAWRALGERQPRAASAPLDVASYDMVLIVGLGRLADLYMRAASQYSEDRVRIAGLLAENERHVGHLVGGKRILGTPETLPEILRDLEVHGVFVTRIVVATLPDQMPPLAAEALSQVETESNIKVDYLAEQLGLLPKTAPSLLLTHKVEKAFKVEGGVKDSLASRPYWRFRRILDIVGSSMLLVTLAPLMPALAIMVAVDVGFPVTFWQQRPGRYGQPFKVVKFRTMRPAHDKNGERIPDGERSSAIGRFMRMTRLDELPQLFNILVGEMSFIGPRPLLPVDQPAAYSARLLVRPGLTGWAQVIGGREINASDKAALDVWYVQNANLLLDIQIVIQTIRMVIFGERVDREAIRRAWDDLHRSGVCVETPADAGHASNVVSFTQVEEGSTQRLAAGRG